MPKKSLTASFVKSIKVDKQTEYYDETTPGLGLRVSPGGTKTFFYRYRYNDKNRRYSIDRFSKAFTLSDARMKVDELRSYVKRGGDPHGEEQAQKRAIESEPKTLKQVIKHYKEKHLPTLKQSTQDDYTARMNSIILGEGKKEIKKRGFDGDRYINDIKRHEILDFLDSIALTAPTNAQRIQAILSGLFKFAKDREWVEVNPASEIRLKRKIKKKKKWQNVAFDNKQIRELWDAFDNHAEPVGSLFKMLLITGQRSGETRMMKWSNINLNKQVWTIPASDTKNGIEHFVPLSEMALDLLDSLKPWSSGEFVFESPVNKGEPVGPAQKSAQRIRKAHDLNAFNIHSLRTTFATRQAGLGTPPQVLSKLLNHKKPGEGSTITAIYNRYDYDDEKRVAMNKWCNELNRIITGEVATVHKLG